MAPLHFTKVRKLGPSVELDALERAQHEAVWKLKTGGAPLPEGVTSVDGDYTVWEVTDEGVPRFAVWVTGGAELVAFLHGTATVANYTIQSGLELDDEYAFSEREWTHACTGEDDCEGCGLPR